MGEMLRITAMTVLGLLIGAPLFEAIVSDNRFDILLALATSGAVCLLLVAASSKPLVNKLYLLITKRAAKMELKSEQALIERWGGKTEPLLSIVCLTYNHAPFIRKTLESFLQQETDFLRGDRPRRRLDRHHRRDRRRLRGALSSIIKPIYQTQNQFSLGVPFSTRLFARAAGKYIAYCEGDDYWTDPSKLQQQVDFLERHRDYVITYHDAFMFSSKGIIQSPQLTGKLRKDATALELMQGRPISTLTVCFRNLIRELPPELLGVEVLDICWWSLLGAYGRASSWPRSARPHIACTKAESSPCARASSAFIWPCTRTTARRATTTASATTRSTSISRSVFGECLSLVSPFSKLRHSRPSPRTSRSTCCAG